MLFCFIFIFIIIIVVIISFIIIIYCFIAYIDWINIFHVMDCIYSIWGSLELASKCQKPVAVTLLVWHLVAWDVLPGGLGCTAK